MPPDQWGKKRISLLKDYPCCCVTLAKRCQFDDIGYKCHSIYLTGLHELGSVLPFDPSCLQQQFTYMTDAKSLASIISLMPQPKQLNLKATILGLTTILLQNSIQVQRLQISNIVEDQSIIRRPLHVQLCTSI
jgi:hypothetical protein